MHEYEDEYVDLISNLMKKLWNQNMTLVAASNFEEKFNMSVGEKIDGSFIVLFI